jgi:hypothetical protein
MRDPGQMTEFELRNAIKACDFLEELMFMVREHPEVRDIIPCDGESIRQAVQGESCYKVYSTMWARSDVPPERRRLKTEENRKKWERFMREYYSEP